MQSFLVHYEILVNESISIKIIDDGRSEYANIEVHQQDVMSIHSTNICSYNFETSFALQPKDNIQPKARI